MRKLLLALPWLGLIIGVSMLAHDADASRRRDSGRPVIQNLISGDAGEVADNGCGTGCAADGGDASDTGYNPAASCFQLYTNIGTSGTSMTMHLSIFDIACADLSTPRTMILVHYPDNGIYEVITVNSCAGGPPGVFAITRAGSPNSYTTDDMACLYTADGGVADGGAADSSSDIGGMSFGTGGFGIGSFGL